jgi:hypothetical protein
MMLDERLCDDDGSSDERSATLLNIHSRKFLPRSRNATTSHSFSPQGN